MKRSPLTIVRLMAAMAFLALGLAALKVGRYGALVPTYWTTILALLFAVIAARVRPGRDGAFWMGFAVFGWAYVLFVLPPWTPWNEWNVSRPWAAPPNQMLRGYFPVVNAHFPTSRWVEKYVDYRTGDMEALVSSSSLTLNLPRDAVEIYTDMKMSLPGIVHLEVAWLFGLVGGVLALFLRPRDMRPATVREAPG